MLGSLRLTVKDAMKELHALGKKLEAGATKGSLDPNRATEILKSGVLKMLENQKVSPDESLENEILSSSNCKV
jgi:hypothetical protein